MAWMKSCCTWKSEATKDMEEKEDHGKEFRSGNMQTVLFLEVSQIINWMKREGFKPYLAQLFDPRLSHYL